MKGDERWPDGRISVVLWSFAKKLNRCVNSHEKHTRVFIKVFMCWQYHLYTFFSIAAKTQNIPPNRPSVNIGHVQS